MKFISIMALVLIFGTCSAQSNLGISYDDYVSSMDTGKYEIEFQDKTDDQMTFAINHISGVTTAYLVFDMTNSVCVEEWRVIRMKVTEYQDRLFNEGYKFYTRMKADQLPSLRKGDHIYISGKEEDMSCTIRVNDEESFFAIYRRNLTLPVK